LTQVSFSFLSKSLTPILLQQALDMPLINKKKKIPQKKNHWGLSAASVHI